MSSKRELPAWMKPKGDRENSKGRNDHNNQSSRPDQGKQQPGRTGQPLAESLATCLIFNGKIHYIYQKDECNFICQNIIDSSQKPVICGFDIEWKVTYVAGKGQRKTAVVQLCQSEKECFVFHLAAMNGFPIALKCLLEDETIIKTGVGIDGDMSKLQMDFQVRPIGVENLSQMLNKVKHINENWSLNGMLIHMVQKRLEKDQAIRCSNWEKFPLSQKQIEYAALDAYASWLLYNEIIRHEI